MEDNSVRAFVPLSPEFLLNHGFVPGVPGMDDDKAGVMGCWDWNWPFNEGDLGFIEKKYDRRQFAVILSLNWYNTGEEYYDYTVFIREDAGCGFVAVPQSYAVWTEYHFNLLYEAIHHKKLTHNAATNNEGRQAPAPKQKQTANFLLPWRGPHDPDGQEHQG